MAIHMIRRFVQYMPEGTIFTTRECLSFGKRAAVDEALYRLVKTERIRRLARGVFAKDSSGTMKFSMTAIAKKKAESFGRRFVEQPFEVPSTYTSEPGKRPDTLVFCIDGRSSKFHINGQLIQLQQVSARKICLAKNAGGEAARAVWSIGKKDGDRVAIMNATGFLNRLDRIDFRRSICWMPAWLSDQIDFRPWDKYFEKYAAQGAPLSAEHFAAHCTDLKCCG
jgi:Family of unknown function (DUF6088)